MLRTSPHNEDFILVVGKSEKDLADIAEAYIVDLFGPVDWVESKVYLPVRRVEVWYGDHSDTEGSSKTFYISEVEVL